MSRRRGPECTRLRTCGTWQTCRDGDVVCVMESKLLRQVCGGDAGRIATITTAWTARKSKVDCLLLCPNCFHKLIMDKTAKADTTGHESMVADSNAAEHSL